MNWPWGEDQSVVFVLSTVGEIKMFIVIPFRVPPLGQIDTPPHKENDRVPNFGQTCK